MSDGSEDCRYRISGFVVRSAISETSTAPDEHDLKDFEFSAENDEKAIRTASDNYDHVSGKEIWRWIDKQTLAVSDQPVSGKKHRYCVRGTMPEYSEDKLRDFFFLAGNDKEALRVLGERYSRMKNKELWRQVGYEYKNTPIA